MTDTNFRVQSQTLKAKPSAELDKVVITAASEVTDDFDNIRAVAADERLRVLQDKTGNPLLLSIGGDDGLYLVQRADNRSGWEEIKLSDAFGNGAEVEAFAVGQDDRGRITIAAAVKDGRASRLFVSYRLNNDPAKANWKDPAWLKWKDLGSRPETKIRRLLVNDHQSRPMIVAGTDHPQEGSRLYWVSRRLRNFARAEKVALQVDADTIVDMAVGKTVAYGEGIFTLHRLRDSMQLTFTSPTEFGVAGYQSLPIPAGAVDQGVLRRLASGKKLNALATVPDGEGFSEVYLGLNGLYRYTVGEIVRNAPAAAEPIAAQLPDIQGIHVKRDHPDSQNSRIVAWVVDGGGTLHETFQDEGSGGWSEPAAIRKNVAQLGANRRVGMASNEIFIVRNDNSLAHLWQDPETRIWTENPVALEDLGKTDIHRAYLTKLSLETEDGAPVQNQAVKLSSSAWAYVKVNGRAVVLEPGVKTRLVVTPDHMGAITIVNRSESLSPPIYRLSADWLTEAAEINPVAPILERLAGVSADDLLNARRGESNAGDKPGAHVLSAKMRGADQRETVQAAAHALSQLASSTDAEGNKPTLLRRLTATEARQPMKAVRRPVFGAEPWKIEFSNSGLASVPAVPEPERTGFFADVGDFLESLGEGILEAGRLVIEAVKEGWRFVCEVAGKVWDFVVETAEQIGKACMWLLDKIEVVWNDIVDWLGMFFNWDDIIRTRDFLSGLVDNGLRFGEDKVGELKKPVSDFFDMADQKIADLVGADDSNIEGKKGPLASLGDKVEDVASGPVGQKAKEGIGFLKTNPVATFISDKIFGAVFSQLLKIEPPEDAGPSIPEVLFDQIKAQMATLDTLLLRIQDHGKEAFGDLEFSVETFSDPTLPDRILQFVIDLGGSLLRALVEVIRNIVLSLIDLMAAMIRTLRVVLTSRISSPVLQSIADFVAKFMGKDSVKLETSLLDMLMLVIAVPTTLVAKLITGEAPIAKGTKAPKFDEVFGSAQSSSDDLVTWSYVSGWASIVTSLFGLGSQTYMVAKTFNGDKGEFESDKATSKQQGIMDVLDNLGTGVSFLSLVLMTWNKGMGLSCYRAMEVSGEDSAKEQEGYHNERNLMLASIIMGFSFFLVGLPKFMSKHPNVSAVKGGTASLASVLLSIATPISRGVVGHRKPDAISTTLNLSQSMMQGVSGICMNAAKHKKTPAKARVVLVPASLAGGTVGVVLSAGRFIKAHAEGEFAEVIYGMPPDW